MGILGTRWEAEFEGHHFTVSRNEVTRGFRVEYDGRTVAKKSWSLIGLGTVEGTIEHGGREVPVKVILSLDASLDGGCTVLVDGKEIAVKHVE